MMNNDDKKVGEGIVVYIRKVDKKGMKIIFSKEENITQMMFYDMVMRNSQFIRFISTQLKDNNKSDNLSINYRQVNYRTEFYYQGQLINKQDNHTILKLRNLSIIHVIVTPNNIQNQLIQQNTQRQSQKQRRLLKQEAVQSQITKQKAADRLQLRDKNYQSQEKNRIKIKQQQIKNSQIVANVKIMTRKNCSILTLNKHGQQQQCNKDINQQLMSIHENKALRLIQKNKNKSVYQSLRDDIKIYQLVRQRLIDREYELLQLRVKVIHLGKVVEIMIDNNNRQNDSNNKTIPQRSINNNMMKISWKQLNILPNSEIIILISSIKLNQSLQSQTQYNNQQIANNNHHHVGSLYLLLENTLTLKLYSQYQNNNKINWNIIYHHHQTQNINHNDSSNNIVAYSIQNINNQVIQTNSNMIDKDITLSYLFDPFTQYYRFIQQQQINNHQLIINQQQPQANEQLQQLQQFNNTLIHQSPQQQNPPTLQLQLQQQTISIKSNTSNNQNINLLSQQSQTQPQLNQSLSILIY